MKFKLNVSEQTRTYMTFIGFVGVWLLLAYCWYYRAELTSPYIRYPSGKVVGGNCSFIWQLYNNDGLLKVENPYFEEITTTTQTEQIICPTTTSQTTTTITCPTTTICPTTTTITCPTCPICPVCFDTEAALTEINSHRPKAESGIWQDGWYTARNLCREALGGKPSKFREGPSIGAINSKLAVNDVREDVFMFKKITDNHNVVGFFVNRTEGSGFQWNDTDCLGSLIWIHRP